MLHKLRDTYTPATLPIHAIVPSLVGFGYSSPPPRHDKFSNLDVAALWDQLMCGLGFGGGYVAQGGDIGSYVTRLLGQEFEACKGERRSPL
jgi:pimeloyl-ACP methyl ester carboxylesterase